MRREVTNAAKDDAQREYPGFLFLVKRSWWLIALVGVAAGLLGYLASAGSKPTYEATTRLLVGPINTDFNTLRASAQLVTTYSDLARSRSVLEAAARPLGLEPTAVDNDVRATADELTRLLTIRVQSLDP